MESQSARLIGTVLFKIVIWRLCLVNKIRVEDVKLVALNNLGWRIVMVIVCLVVLVPLVACLDTVEKSWLPRLVLIFPLIAAGRHCDLSMDIVTGAFSHGIEGYLILSHAFSALLLEQFIVATSIDTSISSAAGCTSICIWVAECLNQRSADLLQDLLILHRVQEVLRIKCTNGLQNGAVSSSSSSSLVKNAEGLEGRAQIAVVVSRRSANWQVIPITAAFRSEGGGQPRSRWLRQLERWFLRFLSTHSAIVELRLCRSMLLHPLVDLPLGLVVVLLDLCTCHVERDLRSDCIKELRVYACITFVEVSLYFYQHVLQLTLAFGRQEFMDVSSNAFGNASPEATQLGTRLRSAHLLLLFLVICILAAIFHGLPERLVLRVIPDERLDFSHRVVHLLQAHGDEELVRVFVKDRHVLKLITISDHQAFGCQVDGPLTSLLDTDDASGLSVFQVELLLHSEPLAEQLIFHVLVMLQSLLF
mmetsp:Transcript_77917/g.138033  ORF Transcript_77917/g.138033 Transcript_77917/m.138033 type:complete len:476 (+) Transcript_77917:282-1709(+)